MDNIKVKSTCMMTILFLLTGSAYAYQDFSNHYGLNTFLSIQEAINRANNGDTIYVPPGIYFENIVINKSVSLIGSNPEDTVIDGSGLNSVIFVIANASEISGFTIRNGFYGVYVDGCSFINISSNKIENNSYGVYLDKSNFNKICKNKITKNNVPIFLRNSQHNDILNNILFHNYGQAVSLNYSNENIIMQNDIRNNPAYGIYLECSENNTVTCNNISYVCQGIHLEFSNNNLIARNTVTYTGPYGIFLNFSDGNYVSENLLIKNEIALQLSNAHCNVISANNITQNKLGFFITCARNNMLRNNTISNNWPFGSFGVYGKRFHDFLNDIDISNNVDGKPIYYFINYHNIRFSTAEVGYVALVNSSNVILENLVLLGNYQAITLASSFNITLRNLQIKNNFQGIYLFQTNFSTLMGSSFKGNIYNFYVHNSHFNLIFHNNFFDGKLLDPSYSQNFWDLGYPTGGNYWSDFTIQDKFMGSCQNITGSDGICDFPLHLYGENVDKYPLAAPVKTFITEYSEDHFTFISNSTILDFHFTPAEGPYILFNVDGPADTIGFCRVSIPKKLLWVSNSEWKVLINNRDISFTKIENEDYVHLFFYYNHTYSSLMIYGTDVIPEFTSQFFSLVVVALFFVTSLMKVRIAPQRFLNGKNLNFCHGK
ncbi:MAG: NosD domain-containing protein [Candidatus Bathyarchaeia archaeon]